MLNTFNYDLRYNYYALLIAIIFQCTAEEALVLIGCPIEFKNTEIDAEKLKSDTEKMYKLREDGMKFKDIAKQFGVSIAVVQGRVRKEKENIRDGGNNVRLFLGEGELFFMFCCF